MKKSQKNQPQKNQQQKNQQQKVTRPAPKPVSDEQLSQVAGGLNPQPLPPDPEIQP